MDFILKIEKRDYKGVAPPWKPRYKPLTTERKLITKNERTALFLLT